MKTATQKQIDEWKEKYGGVYLLELEDGKSAYLKEPSMRDWRRAFSGLKRDGEIGYAEQLIAATWIDGDEEIRKDDDNFMAAKEQLDLMFEYSEATTSQEGGKTKITILGKSCIVRKITRDDLKKAERKNPESKPFVTQEKLFELVKLEGDDEFNNVNDAAFRFQQ